MHRVNAFVLLALVACASAQDLSSLLNQATQLANDALNQAQTQLQQATQDVSGNKDVQDALKATQGLINETRTAVNNGSIWNGAFNGSAIGNISSWAPNLEAYQQWFAGLGNGTKFDNVTLSKKIALPLAHAVAGYTLMSQGVDMLLKTNASTTSAYATSLNLTNGYLKTAIEGLNKSANSVLTSDGRKTYNDKLASIAYVVYGLSSHVHSITHRISNRKEVNTTTQALFDASNPTQVRNLAWTYILLGYTELYNATLTIGSDCDVLQQIMMQFYSGNYSSYLYGDLLTAAASAEALESTLESAFSSNGDSLSSSSLGGKQMPAGCDADLPDGWTSQEVQAWFKKCASNLDSVVQYYASMWSNTDNDLSSNIANISFDFDDKNNKWVFKCGATSD